MFYKGFINKDSKLIHKQSLDSVVELKATTGSKENIGSAVFIDDQNLVTNAHIVTYKNNGDLKAYETYKIRFATELDYHEVQLVDFDSDKDLAILQIIETEQSASAISIGDSQYIKSGQTVYAVGNGMNTGISISKGIVGLSKVNVIERGISREVIQSDITISSGNSGGALLNQRGELIGITSFRLKDSDGYIVYGIGYSIPVNEVMEYYKKVVQ